MRMSSHQSINYSQTDYKAPKRPAKSNEQQSSSRVEWDQWRNKKDSKREILTHIEDSEVQVQIKQRSQLVLNMIYFFQVLPFYIMQFCAGMSIGYPSILVPQLISQNNTGIVVNDSNKGWIVSLDYGTTALIALASGHLQAYFGPKKTSLMACIPITLSWLLMGLAPNMSTIIISRLLVGLGNGILTSSVYIVEIVAPDSRGSVVMIETAFRSFGLICVYLTGAFIDWNTLAWLVVPLPIFSLLYGLFIPESPIYLSQTRGYTQIDGEAGPSDPKGSDNLTKKLSVSENMNMMQRREVMIPLSLLIVVVIAQQCSGIKIIQGYAIEIFADVYTTERSGVKHGHNIDKRAYWAAVIMASVRLVSTLLAARYIRTFGRKTMYFVSAVGTIAFEVAFGFIDYYNLGAENKMLPIIIISCQVFILQIGVQTFPNLLSGELFPNDARARCKGFIRCISSLMSFSMLKIFPHLESEVGLHGSFWILAAILFITLPFMFIYIPEPKDVSLDQVGGFFQPVSTNFYAHFLSNGDLVVPTSEDSRGRIRMIQNCFGTAGRDILNQQKILLAEGILTKSCKSKVKRRHFFLFNDSLMWGTVLRENLNYIRQRQLLLENIQIEDIKDTNSWKIITPVKTFQLEADTEGEKLQWMVLMHYARRDRITQIKEGGMNDSEKKQGPTKMRDPIIFCADKAAEQSNLAVNRLYQLYDESKYKTVLKKEESKK